MQKVQPKNKAELLGIIENAINRYGDNCDLNFIDTSIITDMSYLFCESVFKGDISKWDVSNVENMACMFTFSKFNGDVSRWNVSNVKSMIGMFYDSPLMNKKPKWYSDNESDSLDLLMAR